MKKTNRITLDGAKGGRFWEAILHRDTSEEITFSKHELKHLLGIKELKVVGLFILGVLYYLKNKACFWRNPIF